MTTMIFYERAVALNRERHQNLKIQLKPDHFSFATKTNSVLLAGSEFVEAARDYPIVFVGKEGGPFTLAALVGLGDKENLMVSDAGNWETSTYIPAFIRRYPFVLAGTDDAESLTVCVDEAYSGLNDDQGQALFAAEGSQTDYLTNVIEFLRLFHSEMKRTSQFAARLAELGVLTSKVITIERDGKKQTLEGLWVVDEAKLNALDDASTLELVRSGYMGWIYAHLLSLSNVARLARRLDARRADAPAIMPAVTSDVVH
ncbi:Peptide transport system permease protein sapC [Oxalobacteraceae bacterium IMCC9480]|nr:Peptide transport system permease protein sapC [Oxalobacteraceae bacterium IMCC9480]NDP59642.1 SapC family protein [Oxalobacteraceae bacterium]